MERRESERCGAEPAQTADQSRPQGQARRKGPGISRRTFLYGVGGIVGLCAVGGAAEGLGEKELLRPPGGQDEDSFLAQCLRCDKCRSICPENCVWPAALEDGLISYRTPRLNFHRGYCTFCDLCIEVCPTKAFSAFDPAAQRIGAAQIDRDECIAYRSAGCRVCVDACPYEAVTLDSANRPVVDETKCNGCGKCEYECPSASLGSYSGSGLRGINVVRVDSAEIPVSGSGNQGASGEA